MNSPAMDKAALRGEPSYVWRAGQERRLKMVLSAAGSLINGRVLDNGCGVGMYVQHLQPHAGTVFGMEYDLERAQEAGQHSPNIFCGACENIPLPAESIDLILSHEVLEHVQDDRQAVREMSRLLRPGGRMVIFAPNRGYPFETHGIYWRGKYHFGNVPLVNYLPMALRNRLAPHVRVYSRRQLKQLFTGLPVRIVKRQIIFGAYDNLITRWKHLGMVLRAILQAWENTPLQIFGLSHVWVVEKI
jgi:SAM-dependent methyltransferase